MRLLAVFIALAATLQAAIPLENPRITGSDSKVSSGTFTIKSGATFAVEAGAFFELAAALPLNAGGTGVSLSDPGADRLLFWDDSDGAVDWLTLGTGLSTSGKTLNVTAAPLDATYITQIANGTLTNEFALGSLATGILRNTTTTGVPTIAVAGVDYVAPGAITTSGLTMATDRLLGRSTASTGAVEEITIGAGLTLVGGELAAVGGGGSGDVVGPSSSTDARLALFDSTTGKLLKQSSALTESGGTITSNTAISLIAGGTNQGITLTPSGSGPSIINGGLFLRGTPSTPAISQGGLRMFSGSDSDSFAVLYRASADSGSARLVGMKSRGSTSSPAATQSGDLLFAVQAGGRGSTAWKEFTGSVHFTATQNWTDSAAGTRMIFGTTPNNSVSRVDRMIIEEDGKVAIGTASPQRLLTVSGGGDAIILTEVGSNDANSGGLLGLKARGSISSPSAPQAGDNLVAVGGGGYSNGTLYNYNTGVMNIGAAENWTNSARGTYILFGTTPIGSTTRTNRMIIGHGGNIHIGDSTAAGYLSGASGGLSLTAQGSNQSITLTPVGTGEVRAVNRMYVGEGSVTFDAYQALIIAREGNSYGGALGVHHGSNATDNFAWTFRRARGTLASPSAVQSGDRLGQFTFAGWHSGSAYSNSATIFADATENFGSNRGAEMSFETIPTGSSTRTAALKIDGSQNILAKNGLNVGGGSLGGGTTITRILSGSASLDYGSIAAGNEATLTITVTGAATTGAPVVSLGYGAAFEDGIVVKQAWVSSSNTVSVRVANISGGTIDPASVTVRATVIQF